jgi:hypothetical protein
MAADEPEWDDHDSGHYHDGRDQGEADARDGKPRDDRSAFMPATWAEGYRDGYEDVEQRRAFRAGLRADAGKVP